jgi:hypothetical protein
MAWKGLKACYADAFIGAGLGIKTDEALEGLNLAKGD